MRFPQSCWVYLEAKAQSICRKRWSYMVADGKLYGIRITWQLEEHFEYVVEKGESHDGLSLVRDSPGLLEPQLLLILGHEIEQLAKLDRLLPTG